MFRSLLSLPAALACALALTGAAAAQDLTAELLRKGGKNSGGSDGGTISQPVLRGWMSPEVKGAWDSGYTGQGVTMTVIDDFSSRSRITGNLGTGGLRLRHGEWTAMQAGMVAPSATVLRKDFYGTTTVSLKSGLNVLNLSYGMMAPPDTTINWSGQERSIIAAAANGTAVISKAAGNDGIAIGGTNSGNRVDYLNIDLVGTQSALFVGALSSNGTTGSPAVRASYSNTPGSNVTAQGQYLMVGVEGNETGLYGTSFAAPIVAGYAAILGSKFTGATASSIATQLLDTARQDTIRNYNAAEHGQGEASIANALAPLSIN